MLTSEASLCPRCSLFPQLHDLIKDSRLAKVGGEHVLEFLARQLVVYGTDKRLVRSVVAASSAELLFKLGETGAARGERVKRYALLDPPEDEVQKALVEVGYTAEDAARIVQSCGARLRPLERPLQERHLVPADELIREREQVVENQFEGFFSTLGKLNDGGSTIAAVVALLNRIEAADAAASSAHPRWMEVPDAAIAADISRVAFIDQNGRLHFQSRVHRRIWSSFRASVSGVSGGSGKVRSGESVVGS